MSNYLSSRLAADPAITIEYGAEVTALHGGEKLEAVTVRNVGEARERIIPACALFVTGPHRIPIASQGLSISTNMRGVVKDRPQAVDQSNRHAQRRRRARGDQIGPLGAKRPGPFERLGGRHRPECWVPLPEWADTTTPL
jgi:hypothetical protein